MVCACEHRTHTYAGIIYAAGHRDDCFMAGQGLTRTTMRVPLSALAQCSITYTPIDERYSVLVHVREHPLIILQQDRVFNVSCNREVRVQKLLRH